MRRLTAILPRKSSPTFWLTLILIVGATFRFMQLGAVQHGYDEGYPAYDALRMLDGRQLLLLGQPSSVFLDNPPLMAYLQTIPLSIWRSLWSVYIFVAALNTIAIWFIYRTTRRLLGDPAALVAAFLFAISPWVVHFSRMPWVQGLMPLYTAVIAWGFWPIIVEGKGPTQPVFLAMLALTALILSYILGLAILLPVVILILLYVRHIPKRPLYAGSLILLTGLILFGIGLSRQDGRNSARLRSFFSDNTIEVKPQALEHAVRLVTGLDYARQDLAPGEFSSRQVWSRGAHLLLSVGLLAGGLTALLALRRKNRERRLAVVFLVWFLAPVFSLLFLPYLVHPHYLMLSLPAGHVLFAWGVRPVFQHRRLRLSGWLILLAIAGLFGLNLQRSGEMALSEPTGYGFNGWAVADMARIGATIRQLDLAAGFPRRIVAADNAALLSSISATYVDSLPELQYPDFVLLPGREPLLYVLINQPAGSAPVGPLQERFPEYRVQLNADVVVSFLRVGPYDRAEVLGMPQTVVDWTSDAGLTLMGYSLDTASPIGADEPIVATTYWRVEELHPDRAAWTVSPFIHVVSDEGQILANVTANGLRGDRWQAGDVYVQRSIVQLPEFVEPGVYDLAIGLFDPLQGTRFSLNAPSGADTLFRTPIQIGQ